MSNAVDRLRALVDPEQIELGVRRVRTPEGARKYGQPVGSIIKPNAPGLPSLKKGKAGVPGKPGRGKAGIPGKPGGSKRSGPAAKGAAPGSDETKTSLPGKKPSKGKGGGDYRPMSDAEYQAHAERVGEAVQRDWTRGTDKEFSLDGKGKKWEKERARLHIEIADRMYEEQFADIPSDGKAMFSGGLGGAGKGTILSSGRIEGFEPDQYGTVNPDDVKEFMAKQFPDMIPDREGYSSKMEASAVIHEESSHIALMIAERAYAERKNMVWDITMGSERSVDGRIKKLREAGYEQIEAVFVDIPVEVSVKRALSRHRNGMEKRRRFEATGEFPRGRDGEAETEEPLGGRFVPPSVIRLQADGDTSKNRKAFEALKDQFDTWQLWDNGVDGRQAEQVETGRGRTPASRGAILDRERRQRGKDRQAAGERRRELEAEREKLAERLGVVIARAGLADDPEEMSPAEKALRRRLAEIRDELGLSAVGRLRGMLHL